MLHIQKHASIILLIILGVSFALSIGAMKDDTATFDERAHIPAAYSSVRYGDMRLNPEHPPLLKDLTGLPLLFLGLNFPIQSDLWTNGITKEWQNGTSMWSTWGIGTEFLYKSGNDAESILFWSRLPIVLLSILLGFFIYRFTKELAGTSAGLFATLLYAFDPNVLAHDHYVTTDLGIAAFIFVATYYFVRFLKDPSPKHIALAGLTLGLAQLAKFSAIILIPLFGLIVIVAGLTRKRSSAESEHPRRTFRIQSVLSLLWSYCSILIIAFTVVWAGYIANTWNMHHEITVKHADLVFSGDAPAKVFARDTVDTLAQTPGLAPIAHYLLGVFMVFSRVTGGNSFYFLGDVPNQASKLYFPTVFFLKETLPLIFLIVFTGLYAFFRAVKPAVATNTSLARKFSASFQNNIPQYTMLSFVLFYAYLSISGNLNIGFRHLFPILPFVYVLVTVTLFRFMKNCSSTGANDYCPTRHTSHILLGAFAFWIAVIPIIAFPNYLSYYNEIIGAKNGHTVAVDSNYDWGQNLKRLKIWVDTYNDCTKKPYTAWEGMPTLCKETDAQFGQPITNINIDYYGGSEVSYYFPEESYTAWHSNNAPKPGWFAVSATFFEENTHKVLKPGETDYKWLLNYEPVGRAGDSILIFYVSPESLGVGM